MKEDIFNYIKYQLTEHCGRSIGIILGFIVAVLILLIGFFPTLFIVICMGIGCYIGNVIDKDNAEQLENLIYKIQRFLPPYSRR